MLYIVHEIDAHRSRRTRVERGQNAGLSVGGYLRHLAESCVSKEAHGKVAAFADTFVLGGNRRLPDPLLQTLQGFVVALLDLRANRSEVARIGPCPKRPGQGRRARDRTLKESSPMQTR